MRGCWRLCCRTRGRGRATAEDGMCSRVDAVEREASPKLSRHMEALRERETDETRKTSELEGTRGTQERTGQVGRIKENMKV